MSDTEWTPGRWWRVLDPQGHVWAESSDEAEVRASMRPGDRLERAEKRTEWRWVETARDDAPPDPA